MILAVPYRRRPLALWQRWRQALLDTEVPQTYDALTPRQFARICRYQAMPDADMASAHASGVRYTPTFFINGLRYDGPWDEASFTDAMLGSLGHRTRVAALQFASWAPATGVILLLATLAALFITNSSLGPAFEAFWQTPFGFSLGDAGFRMSLLHWVNDALLTVFFLVVGLEIKREFTVGHLASRSSAALPIAAALAAAALPSTEAAMKSAASARAKDRPSADRDAAKRLRGIVEY